MFPKGLVFEKWEFRTPILGRANNLTSALLTAKDNWVTPTVWNWNSTILELKSLFVALGKDKHNNLNYLPLEYGT